MSFQMRRIDHRRSQHSHARTGRTPNTHEVNTVDKEADFYFWHVAVALGIFALVLLIVQVLDLDRRLAAFFYDPSIGGFPLRDHWLVEGIDHVAARDAVIILAISVLVVWFGARRLPGLQHVRLVVLFVFAGMVLSSLVVHGIRSASSTHCPYDLQEYGGKVVADGQARRIGENEIPGKCWPSAHASAGFCLFSWYFAARSMGRRRLGAYLLAGAVLFGIALSAGRIAQGAHFASHCIWSAIVCWFVTVALYRLMLLRNPPAEEINKFAPCKQIGSRL
jgi:membrane-associated PAP2 superfamily phosphatase